MTQPGEINSSGVTNDSKLQFSDSQEICPEMHALAKMAEMAPNCQNRQTVKQKFK